MRTWLRRAVSGLQIPASVLVLACVVLLGGTGEAGLQKGALKFAAANREEKLLANPVAALRAAQTAQAAGKLARARAILREVSVRHPAISDYADALHAQIALDQADPKRALLIAQRALAANPSPLVESALYGVLAQAEASLGNGVAARAAWAEALAAPHSIQDRPGFELAIADSLQADGELELAQAKYLDVWAYYPLSEQAGVAGTRLDALAETLKTDPREPGIAYRRAENLYNANRNALALQEFEDILATEGTSARLRKRAGRQRANVLFRMRRYPEAIVAYQDLPANSQIKILIARARARSGDVNGAVTELLELDKSTPKGRPQRAGYLAALLLDDESGRELEAAELFKKLDTPRNAGGIRNESTWRLGWRAYRDGKYPEAIRHFENLARYEGDGIAGLRPRYWRARALEKQGDLAAAKEAFLVLASEYPLTYYGWRSRLRESPSDADATELPVTEPEQGSPLDPAELLRIRILAQAGFAKQAGGEIARLSSTATGVEDRLRIAELYSEAGHFNAAQTWIISAYVAELPRGPAQGKEELWSHAWPRAYEAEVARATRSTRGRVDPNLVFAVMREESGYRPAVISPAGARGLLQIMEKTGTRLAADDGRAQPFDTELLFEPETNLALGTRYLGELKEQFGGQLAPAIASYNAGPSAVQGWVDSSDPDEEEDEWVESIPYEQTRNYVKRVLRSMSAYQAIY